MAATASQPSSGSAPTSGGPAAPATGVMLTEVPVSLKQLARLVVRGFYPAEEALIVDMLVRYPCVREEDLAGNIFIMLTWTGHFEITNILQVFKMHSYDLLQIL